jgi:hypothetical protein
VLLQKCTERVGGITVLEAKQRVEKEARFTRALGYESLTVKLSAR